MMLERQASKRARCLGKTVNLTELALENFDAALEKFWRDWRRAVRNMLEGREIRRTGLRQLGKKQHHDRHQQGDLDLLLHDYIQQFRRIDFPNHDDGHALLHAPYRPAGAAGVE